MFNFYGGNKKALDPPLSKSPLFDNLIPLSIPLSNTVPYFIKSVQSWNLTSIIMKPSSLPTQRNLRFFQVLKEPEHVNWIKHAFVQYKTIVLLVSSLLPLPVLTYQAQPKSYNPSCTQPSIISLTIFDTSFLAIALIVELK